MKNTILRDGLRNVPLLNPVLITIRANTLFLSSYTEGTALLYTIPVDAAEDVNVMLLPDAVKNLVKMLSGKDSDVVLKMMDQNLFVSLGKKKAIFTATPDKDTVKAAKMLRDNVLSPSFKCDIQEFSNAISATSHYSGDRTIADVRFHGYHLTVDDKSGEVMSSNNKGMSIRSFPLKEVSETKTILVSKDIQFLIRGITGEASVEFRGDSKLFLDVSVGAAKYRILCGLINSQPLAYRAVLPNVSDKTNLIKVSKAEMLEAIGEAGYFSPDDTYKKIRFTITEDSLTLSAVNSENGRMEATISASSEKEDEFEVSYTTLSQAISNSSNDILTFEVYTKRVVLENGSRNILAKFEV